MKTAILFAAAVVSVSSVPIMAQQATPAQENPAAPVQANESATAQATAGSATTTRAARVPIPPVSCELAGKLDSKSAKAGDAVVVKTHENIRTADGTVVPRGARLVGHVTDVQAHDSAQTDAHLTIAFDHAEWSGGHTLAIRAVIEGVTPPDYALAGTSQNDDLASGQMGAGSRGGTRGGGGILGATNSTTGNLGSRLDATAGGTLRDTGLAADSRVNATLGATTSLVPHVTGISGVLLSSDASGAATTSGTLSCSRKNVHLDSGTQLVLVVSAAAPAR